MIILYDYEAAIVVKRMRELEELKPEYREEKDKYNRSLADRLEQAYDNGLGKEF